MNYIFMAIFIAIYLGIVFLIASSAILALKQLTESSDNKQRYSILRKIGCDEKMIKAESATGHTPGAEATCTTPQLCEVCGTVLAQATGHHYETEIVAPTCTAMGYTVYTCPDCGKQHAVFGESHLDRIAAQHHIPVLARLPIRPALASQMDSGTIELFEGDFMQPAADRLCALLPQ